MRQFPEEFRHCSLEALTHGNEVVFCLVRAGLSGSIKSELLDYGKLRLWRQVFPTEGLVPQLETFNNTGKLSTSEGAITFEGRFNSILGTFHPSRSAYHPWPGCLYEMAATGHATPGLQEPLVGRGLPPFFNPRDAVTNWIRRHSMCSLRSTKEVEIE